MNNHHAHSDVADSIHLLDLTVKYAALGSWFIYAAGVAYMVRFLETVDVPMDPDFFALPKILNNGGSNVLEILLAVAATLAMISVITHRSRFIVRLAVWTIPICFFAAWEHIFFQRGLFKLRLICASNFLLSTYAVLLLITDRKFFDSGPKRVLAAVLIFWSVVQGAGTEGEIDARQAITSHPIVQFLLPQEDVEAATKIGFTFSSSPGLCDPVVVAALNDKNYYVWIPLRLSTPTSVSTGLRIDWTKNKIVALPRDRIRLAAAQH